MSVLSIAGFDPSGGAGVLADVKTFAANGVDGCAVVTAVTAQNARTVTRVEPVAPDLIRAQLDAVLAERPIAAVKIGMLGTAGVARAVAAVLRESMLPNIVVDPVIRASTGAALLDDEGIGVLRAELLPLANGITPNATEAGILLGRAAPATVREMRDTANALRALGPAWVLVTGGHVEAGDDCVDVLCGPGTDRELRVARVASAGMHGTGCRLSSAIAARLALGEGVIDACAAAQRQVAAAMMHHEQTLESVS